MQGAGIFLQRGGIVSICYLQQPGEPFTRLHLVHFSAPGAQHFSEPLTWPQPLQRTGAAGSLQQPGEPLVRLHLVHFSASESQHFSVPFTSPHFVHNLAASHALWHVPLPQRLAPLLFSHPATNKVRVIVARANIPNNRFIFMLHVCYVLVSKPFTHPKRQ